MATSPYKSNSTLILKNKSYLVSMIQDNESIISVDGITPYQIRLIGRCVKPMRLANDVTVGVKCSCIFNNVKGSILIFNITQSRWIEVVDAQGMIFYAYFYPLTDEIISIENKNPFAK